MGATTGTGHHWHRAHACKGKFNMQGWRSVGGRQAGATAGSRRTRANTNSTGAQALPQPLSPSTTKYPGPAKGWGFICSKHFPGCESLKQPYLYQHPPPPRVGERHPPSAAKQAPPFGKRHHWHKPHGFFLSYFSFSLSLVLSSFFQVLAAWLPWRGLAQLCRPSPPGRLPRTPTPPAHAMEAAAGAEGLPRRRRSHSPQKARALLRAPSHALKTGRRKAPRASSRGPPSSVARCRWTTL